MRLNLKVEGSRKTIAGFKTYKWHKLDEVRSVVNKTASRVNRGAKKRAPVDDGRLRASITQRGFRGGYEVEVGTNVHYAVYQEYGTGIYAVNGGGRKTPWAYVNKKGKLVFTRGNKPKPFLIPAYEKEKPTFIPELRKALKGW